MAQRGKRCTIPHAHLGDLPHTSSRQQLLKALVCFARFGRPSRQGCCAVWLRLLCLPCPLQLLEVLRRVLTHILMVCSGEVRCSFRQAHCAPLLGTCPIAEESWMVKMLYLICLFDTKLGLHLVRQLKTADGAVQPRSHASAILHNGGDPVWAASCRVFILADHLA